MKRVICSALILSGLVFVGMGCGDDSTGKACPETLTNAEIDLVKSFASLGAPPTQAAKTAVAQKCDAWVNAMRANIGCKGSNGKILDKEMVSQAKAKCQTLHP